MAFGLGNFVSQYNLAIVVQEQRRGQALTDLSNRLRHVENNVNGYTDAQNQAANATSKWRQSLTKIGDVLQRLLLPLLAVAAGAALKFAIDSVKEWAKFDHAMRETFTLLPGMSEEAMGTMTRDARILAVEYGNLATEVAPAMYQALSAGVPEDEVYDAVELASRAARAGVAGLTETMVTGQAVVNAYGGEVYELGEVYDIIFTLIRLGVVTMDDLNANLQNTTSVAAESGTAFEDIAAALVVMTRQGDSATEATELLQMLLMQLGTDGTSAFEAFKEASGVAYRDYIANGNSLIDALILMQEHADETGESLTAMIAGDSRFYRDTQAARAIAELTGVHMPQLIEAGKEFLDVTGATDEAFAVVAESAVTSIDKMKSAWNDYMLETGENVWDILGQRFIEGSTSFFRKNSGNMAAVWKKEFDEAFLEAGTFDEQFALFKEVDKNMVFSGVINATDEMKAGYDQALSSLALYFDEYQEFENWLAASDLLQKTTGPGGDVQHPVIGETGTRAETLYEEAKALEAARLAWEKYIFIIENFGVAGADVVLTQEKAKIHTLELKNTVGWYATDTEKATVATSAFARSLDELTRYTHVQFQPTFIGENTVEFISDIQSTVTELFDAYEDLDEAQVTYVGRYKDNTEEIGEINDKLIADITNDQRGEFWDILTDINKEGSAEWLQVWQALQGDLTESQRIELLAQKADLEAQQGMWEDTWSGSAEDVEDAEKRIATALEEIQRKHRELALEEFQFLFFRDFGEQSLEAQKAIIEMQRMLGLIDENQANFLVDELEKATLLKSTMATMWDDYTDNGKGTPTLEEMQTMATAADLIMEGMVHTETAAISMAENSLNPLRNMGKTMDEELVERLLTAKNHLMEIMDNSPYIPKIEVDTADAEKELKSFDSLMSTATRDRTSHVYVETHQRAGGPEEGAGAGGPSSNASGLDLIVPPGFERDTFGPMYAKSGEHILITPAGQGAYGGSSMQVLNRNDNRITIINNNAAAERLTMAQLGFIRAKNQQQWMG